MSDEQIENEIVALARRFAEDPEQFFFYAASKILGVPVIEAAKRFRSVVGIK